MPYLPVLGPAPLRFESAVPSSETNYTMLPLKMHDDPPVEEPSKTPEPPKAASVSSTNLPANPVSVPAASAPAPKPEPASPVPEVHSEFPVTEGTNDPALTPQMLLRFFNTQPAKGTGPETIISVPVKPAATPAGQSSSATYTTQ